MRVHELARALALPVRDVVDLLRADGEWVNSHLSVVPQPVANRYLPGGLELPEQTEAERSSARGRPIQSPPSLVAVDARTSLIPRPHTRRRPGPRPIRLNGTSDDDYDEPDWRRYREPDMTTGDVANHLGVTQAAVRRWVARGYISPIGKLGPSNVFRTSDVLDAYEQIAARQKATGKPGRIRSRWFVEKRPIDRVPAKYWDSALGINEAANLVEVSPATIRSWIHRGHLTPLTFSTPRSVRLRGVDVIRAAHGRRLPGRRTRPRRRPAG